MEFRTHALQLPVEYAGLRLDQARDDEAAARGKLDRGFGATNLQRRNGDRLTGDGLAVPAHDQSDVIAVRGGRPPVAKPGSR